MKRKYLIALSTLGPGASVWYEWWEADRPSRAVRRAERFHGFSADGWATIGEVVQAESA